MACIDIWTIVYPPDPDALGIGGKSSVTVVSMNPPPANTIATSVTKTTVCTETEAPVLYEPTGDLVFEADGDDWVAPNSVTQESDIINIEIPVESTSMPETVSISFQYTPINLAQRVGEVIIYVPAGSVIYMINSSGETIGTINTSEAVNQIKKTASAGVVWIGDSGGLFEITAGVSVKTTTLGTVSGLGIGAAGETFVFDDSGLTDAEKDNHRIRLYNSGDTPRKLRLIDSPEHGCFAFNDDGTFVHGTNSDPTATTGHTFALATKYTANQLQWRHEFTDWEYGDASEETIVDAAFDEEGNCYCLTRASVGTVPVITCDVRLASSTGRGPEWTLSSAYSTMTFDYGSFSSFDSVNFLNLSESTHYYLKVTSLEVYGSADGGLTFGWHDLSAEADWWRYSYVTYDGGFIFEGTPSYGEIKTYEASNITGLRLTYTFEEVA